MVPIHPPLPIRSFILGALGLNRNAAFTGNSRYESRSAAGVRRPARSLRGFGRRLMHCQHLRLVLWTQPRS